MQLITKNIDKKVREKIIKPAQEKDFVTAGKNTIDIQQEIYTMIPDEKRSSYGVMHTIKILSKCIANQLIDHGENLLNIGTGIYSKGTNQICRGVALGILSEYGREDFANTSPFFISAALSNDWQLREYAQMFFRKLIHAHPKQAKEMLLESVKNHNPRLRRFVSETLRPVQENKWLLKDPQYSISIIQHLFFEKDKYPQTSVAKNLSDLSKKKPDLIMGIIQNLTSKQDENAYQIAYRASRNLIKQYPQKVMETLGIEEYKSKNTNYKLSDYRGNKSQVSP